MRARSFTSLGSPRTFFVFASALALGTALYACSTTPGGPLGLIDHDDAALPNESGAGTDTGTADTSTVDDDASEGSAPGHDSAAPDTDAATADEPDGFVPLAPIPCTQAELDAVASAAGGDYTAAGGVAVVFPIDGLPVQYTNHCVKVKVGDVVTFEGKFSFHPLGAFGGNVPSPIPHTTIDPPVGASGKPELAVTMTTAGNYGFRCDFHPGQMFGAVQVVP
jgi:plastocyanin